jgi:hypothetical protein
MLARARDHQSSRESLAAVAAVAAACTDGRPATKHHGRKRSQPLDARQTPNRGGKGSHAAVHGAHAGLPLGGGQARTARGEVELALQIKVPML